MPRPRRQQYLGRVKRAPRRLDTYRYATVEPLVVSDPDGTEWRDPIADAQERFPKRGLVHWHSTLPQLLIGSLWQFAIDEHLETGRGDRQERFQLEDPIEPIEVIDLRGWTDEMSLRSVITNEGVELAPAPISRRLVLWVASGVCIGPLLLRRTPDSSRWMLDAPEGHRDSARMPVWSIGASDINQVNLEGTRWFVAPPQELGPNAGIQNWSPDGQVVRSILRRLRKMDSQVVKARNFTDSVFDEYLEHLNSAGFSGVDPGVERARADRLRGIRAAIERDESLLTEAAETLAQSESVRSKLEQEAEEVRKKLFEEKRLEVESTLGSRQDELARLAADIEERQRRITQLDAILRTKELEIESKVASFDQEVSSRLEEIAKRPETAFADNAILRAALLPLRGFPRWPDPTIRGRPPARPTASGSEGGIEQLPDEAALRGEIGRLALARGMTLHAVLTLHAAFVAGVTPVLIGERAYDLARLYASAAAGERLHWVPAGSSLMEPQDLLGRFNTSLGRIVPHPGGILDVIRDATISRELHLVVLEGFNRAPVEAYLLPILEAASAARQGDTNRSIPVASASVLSDDDPYCELSRVVWPQNVLLACIPAHGSATLPVPVSAWHYLAVIDADDRERPVLSLPEGVTTVGSTNAATEVTADVWCSLNITKLLDVCASGKSLLERLVIEWKLSDGDASAVSAVYGVLCRNGLPPMEAVGVAVACTLVPRCPEAGKTLDGVLRGLGVPEPLGWRLIQDEVERLRD